MSIIEVEQLSKVYRTAIKQPNLMGTLRHFVVRRYKDVSAVSQVSFRIEPGEMVGFLGANGAGKTTTLKMLTGLVRPSAGTARVAEHIPFERRREFLQQITLVMGQKQQLIWDLPAIDSLRINAAVYELEKKEAARRIEELSNMLDVREQLKVPVRKLSLGERMKCELLAALLHRPRVLFLDEPTLGLDVNAQEKIRNFLREYNLEFGATVLLTSHYMADILALCRRVILMHEGRLLYDGSLESIVERFAPYREVEVTLLEPLTAAEVGRYGELQSLEGRSAHLIVDRSSLTETIERIFHELKPTDLSIKDPPIEQVIGRLLLGKGPRGEGDDALDHVDVSNPDPIRP